jgi:hypothetical protein
MKKSIQLLIAFSLFFYSGLHAQNSLSNGKALSIPAKKFGISIGNSHEFTGIRMNFADKDVKKINGINLTLWFSKFQNEDAVVNGISFGVIPTAGAMQPINIGLLGVGTADHNLNGLSLGGIVIGSGGNINGISVSGIITMADGENSGISGLALSGIGLGAKRSMNGLMIAGFAIGTEENINGFAASLAYVSADSTYRGIAITPGYFCSGTLTGLSFASYANTGQTNGLSFGLINRTKELHGIQIGLWNHAGNNPKGFRNLPILNLHFGKK